MVPRPIIGGRSPEYLSLVKLSQSANLTVGASAGVGQGYFLSFTADDFPNFATYAGLYRFFKLKKVVVSIEPLAGVNLLASETTIQVYNQCVHSCIDPIQATPPGSAAVIMNDQSYKRTKFLQRHVRVLYPKIIENIDVTPGTTVQTLANAWISVLDSSDTTYGGIRVYFDSPSSVAIADGVPFNLYIQWHMTFRSPAV